MGEENQKKRVDRKEEGMRDRKGEREENWRKRRKRRKKEEKGQACMVYTEL